MSEIELGGEYGSAVTHLASVGLAAIVAGSTSRDTKLWWTERLRPMVDLSIDFDEAAALVRDHANARTQPDSWVMRTLTHEGRETGLFSPRIKVPSSVDSWDALQSHRRAGVDREWAEGRYLDVAFIHALGEPAHWRRARDGSPRPDEGASRWEMKTRNRGDEFVQNRLRELARAVADRSVEAVSGGLLGTTIVDEVGGGKEESRASTGLTRPGPVDNALVWCALWGLSMLPVRQLVDGRSATTSFVIGSRPAQRPDAFALPVMRRPTTLGRWARIARSPQLLQVGAGWAGARSGDTVAAATQLRTWGLGAVAVFPVEEAGSGSAPERRLLNALTIPLMVR